MVVRPILEHKSAVVALRRRSHYDRSLRHAFEPEAPDRPVTSAEYYLPLSGRNDQVMVVMIRWVVVVMIREIIVSSPNERNVTVQ